MVVYVAKYSFCEVEKWQNDIGDNGLGRKAIVVGDLLDSAKGFKDT